MEEIALPIPFTLQKNIPKLQWNSDYKLFLENLSRALCDFQQ